MEKLEQLSMEQKKLQGLLEIMNTMDKVNKNIIENKGCRMNVFGKRGRSNIVSRNL